jgi:hypothetical protein
MSAGAAGFGAVRQVGGLFKWAGEHIVSTALLIGALFVVANMTPYAVMMVIYHDTPQVGVDKATHFIKFVYTVGGAGYESKAVIVDGFKEGQVMTQESLAKESKT